MRSLHPLADRHVVIDKRPNRYVAFPDVALAADGTLLCVYRESDRHVAASSKLLLRSSPDLGRSWAPIRILNAAAGHCPRISRLRDDALVVIEDFTASHYWSYDHGRSFAASPTSGVGHGIPDRILELDANTFLTTGHAHRGVAPRPKIRQAPTEQMLYRSDNRGSSYSQRSLVAHDPNLVLCEASMARLPDGRILALLRENSSVYEPMYCCVSKDNGDTWSLPRPTPLLGHRPCLGLASDGRLLVTYRDVGPDGRVSAWLGTEEELGLPYAVHGRTPSPDNPVLTPEALVIENRAGPDACARYCLRPLTDPERARAELTVSVKVDWADPDGCGVRFGLWWRLFPDRVEPEGDRRPIPLEPGRFNELRFVYSPGRITLSVNGARRASVTVDPSQADVRPMVFGSLSPVANNGGRHAWRRLALRVREPGYDRDYRHLWTPEQGHPDAWVREHVLELQNDRFAAAMDYGYSGWVELPDGRFFCAYHLGGGLKPGYQPGLTSHVQGTWFEATDFT